jgi:polyhydroxyalkanoate synthase
MTTAEKRENPAPRQGPRPLGLHLGSAAANWMSSLAVLPLARNGSLTWSGALAAEAEALANELAKQNPEALAAAISGEIRHRMAEFVAGIESYREHPYRPGFARGGETPGVIWQQGSSRLLDYGGATAERGARTVLFVPSLINRAYILDLAPERSLMRYLAAAGLRPMLLDWGAPVGAERDFGLDDYIAGLLFAALDAACEAAGGPVVLGGYCMGGLLTLPAALARPKDISALILMATPWDFHSSPQGDIIGALRYPLEAIIAGTGTLPVDVIQSLFTALDPMLAARKFRRFAKLPPKSAAARGFVALEDWLNDGVDLAGPTARECLFGWYVENVTARGRWRVAGTAIHPQRLSQPVLNIVPMQDRIVPPESAEALSALIPAVETWRPALGHIGMIASPRAKRGLWRRLATWLETANTGR